MYVSLYFNSDWPNELREVVADRLYIARGPIRRSSGLSVHTVKTVETGLDFRTAANQRY